MKEQSKLWTRRRFLGSAAIGLAGIAVIPAFTTSCKGKKKVVSQENEGDISLGFIGLGQQAMFLLSGFLQVPGVKVVAGCDVYGIKRKRFEKRVTDFYTGAGKEFKVDTYEKYQDVLSREDIDAVVIAVPDHNHAMIAIAACKAGKDRPPP